MYEIYVFSSTKKISQEIYIKNSRIYLIRIIGVIVFLFVNSN